MKLPLALLCAFAVATGIGVAQTPEPVTLRVGAAPDDQSKPILYAQQAGLFAKAGLNVQLVSLTGGGAAIAAAVAGGSLDLGKSNSLELIAAHVRGLPFTIVAPGAGTGTGDHNGAIIVAARSPLRTARDLNGKTIGVISLVTIQSIAVRSWIDANGGDSTSVHFVEVPPSATQAALDQGRIDAASVLEPILSQATAAGARVLAYPYGSIAPHFDGADYFTTTDFVAKRRDVVERFARVMHDANVFVAAHEAETNGLVAAYSKIDPAVLAHMAHSERPAYLDPAALQALIDQAAKYKYIGRTFAAHELISDAALKPPK
jgi:NitT/TauT family transport system substrate-binding protein